MRWGPFIFLLLLVLSLGGGQTLQAKDSIEAIQKASPCESFGIQTFLNKKEAPSFSLKDLNGKQVSLNDYSGRPLMVFFWASWCPSCKEDLPLLEKFFGQQGGGSQFNLLTIAIDGEKEKRIKSIIKDQRITLPVLLDLKEKVARSYGVKMVPTAFLISEERYVKGIIVGQRDWCAPEAHMAIREVFNLR